jgi:hypothetical protein
MTKFSFASLDGAKFEADWPVLVNVPQDGGGVDEQEFMARFRLLSEDETKAIDSEKEPQKALLRAAVVGFGRGEEQAFSPELLEKMMGRPYVRAALAKAYVQFSLGVSPKN